MTSHKHNQEPHSARHPHVPSPLEREIESLEKDIRAAIQNFQQYAHAAVRDTEASVARAERALDTAERDLEPFEKKAVDRIDRAILDFVGEK